MPKNNSAYLGDFNKAFSYELLSPAIRKGCAASKHPLAFEASVSFYTCDSLYGMWCDGEKNWFSYIGEYLFSSLVSFFKAKADVIRFCLRKAVMATLRIDQRRKR